MSYEAGRSKSYNHGVPTTDQTGDPGFMQGYRDAEDSRRFQASLLSPSTATPWRGESTENPPRVAQPSEPLTLGSAIKGLAGTGIVLGALYAFFVLNAVPATIATYAVAGLLTGAVAGVAVFVAAKILQFAIWVLVWAVKIGAILAIMYFAWAYFAR